MKRIFTLLPLVLLLFSCRENIVENVQPGGNSNLYISTDPIGADIYLDGTRTYKMTPDSLARLTPGLHNIRLKLLGYGEANFDIYLSKGEKRYISHSFNNDF
jgi:hypothetical protein